MSSFVRFDDVWDTVEALAQQHVEPLRGSGVVELAFVRDLWGRVRAVVSENWPPTQKQVAEKLAGAIADRLGAHGAAPAVLDLRDEEFRAAKQTARRVELPGLTLYLAERQVTASDWSSVEEVSSRDHPPRWSMFSIKGGLGRSTTAAVLSRHCAEKGKRVLVLDCDLESPGVSSLLLEPQQWPEFGIVDWFVEDLVGQSDQVVPRMTASPRWAQDLEGEILVAPAFGEERIEYLEKLGRVYLDLPPREPGGSAEPWIRRFQRLIKQLEDALKPDAVVVDSRNGLHDLAAAAVTAIDAFVLVFAVDSDATWSGYRILFEHLNRFGLSERLREKLKMVASLVPEVGQREYLSSFCERSWELLRETMYDEVPGLASAEEDLFSFDLADETGPHYPVPIYWNRGFTGGFTLQQAPEASVRLAYGDFLSWFDRTLAAQ